MIYALPAALETRSQNGSPNAKQSGSHVHVNMAPLEMED
jgi:hypothetical protein